MGDPPVTSGPHLRLQHLLVRLDRRDLGGPGGQAGHVAAGELDLDRRHLWAPGMKSHENAGPDFCSTLFPIGNQVQNETKQVAA